MKKILATTLAAIAVAATPAAAQGVSVGGSVRIGDSGYVHIQTRPDYSRDYRYRDRGRYDYNDYNRYDRYGCRGDRLTVHNLPGYGGYLYVDGRRYRADRTICTYNLRDGAHVFYNRNNNGRYDRSDYRGRIRYWNDRSYNRNTYRSGDQYTVTLHR